jgi:SAM-dependent methyltransferase
MNDQTPIVYGNHEDKYGSTNPVYQLLVSGFLNQFHALIGAITPSPTSICEVGCGEGELLHHVRKQFPSADIFGTDLSAEHIAMAAKNNEKENISFSVQDAQNLTEYDDRSFDLVICAEVLEHLSNPEKGLQELLRIAKADLFVSVPNEPIWRILNMMRGKYWHDYGNTPGHVNKWSIFGFPRFLQSQPDVELIKKKYPFPWQMVWLRKTIK